MPRKHLIVLIRVSCSIYCLSEDCRLVLSDLPASIIRILINFYVGNHVRVAWNGVKSEYFNAANGVKQGGVLGPVLFCVYIDGLLLALQKANVGCCVGSRFVGALTYADADDIVLLAPTSSAMRRMLDLC